MAKITSLLPLLLFISSPASAFGQKVSTEQADALVSSALKAWDVPGAAVVVVDRGGGLYRRGHGVVQLGRPDPVTIDTVFPLASCTKAFTATVIAQLADDGRLKWDDAASKHLPGFRLDDPLANAGASLRDLMCHRTGLASHDELWYHTPWTPAEQVRRAGSLPLDQPFRTRFQYQSVMVAAAGLAAGHTAGQPWEQLVRNQIFVPLGMRTATSVEPAATSDRAEPHRLNADGKVGRTPRYPQTEPNPAGSIHASVNDLAPWLIFHLNDGTYQGRRLVSERNLAEMHTPQIPQRFGGATAAYHPDTTMMSYGLGWVVQDYRGTLLCSHTGIVDGFPAQIALAPTAGFGIAVLSNRHETRMNQAIVNSLLDRLLGLPPRDWNEYLLKVVKREEELAQQAQAERVKRRQPGPPPRPLGDYAGRYDHPAYGPMTVALRDGRLTWEWLTQRVELLWSHAGEFDFATPLEGQPSVNFVSEGGTITGMVIFGVTLRKQPG